MEFDPFFFCTLVLFSISFFVITLNVIYIFAVECCIEQWVKAFLRAHSQTLAIDGGKMYKNSSNCFCNTPTFTFYRNGTNFADGTDLFSKHFHYKMSFGEFSSALRVCASLYDENLMNKKNKNTYWLKKKAQIVIKSAHSKKTEHLSSELDESCNKLNYCVLFRLNLPIQKSKDGAFLNGVI